VCSRRINFRKQYFYIDIGVQGGKSSAAFPHLRREREIEREREILRENER